MEENGDVEEWLAAFFGTFLSTLLLGVLTKTLLRVDFILGVMSGSILGFLFGIAFMARKYGKPESVPGWVLQHAQTGWQFGLKVFLVAISIGIAAIAWFSWMVFAYRRFGEATVDYWAMNLLLVLLPIVPIAILVYLYYLLRGPE